MVIASVCRQEPKRSDTDLAWQLGIWSWYQCAPRQGRYPSPSWSFRVEAVLSGLWPWPLKHWGSTLSVDFFLCLRQWLLSELPNFDRLWLAVHCGVLCCVGPRPLLLLFPCLVKGRHISGWGKCASPLSFGGAVLFRLVSQCYTNPFWPTFFAGCSANARRSFSPLCNLCVHIVKDRAFAQWRPHLTKKKCICYVSVFCQ